MNKNAIEECVDVLVQHYRAESEKRQQPFANITDQYDAGFCAGILESISVLDDLMKGEKP